jgi:transposase
LLTFDGVTIFPINPAALNNYRKAFAHGGGKNDPTDARLIVQYLDHYRDQLRPLRQDSPLTRELAALGEDRRRMVDQRTALSNQLKALLKQYFPAVLRLDAAKIYAEFLIRFLLKFPTLEAAQQVGRTRLRKFFFGFGEKAKAEQRLDRLLTAVPLTQDPVLIRTHARRTQAVCQLIDSLNRSIQQYNLEIKRLVRQHADYAIVASLPGSSYKTHCRMLAALGDDRTRYCNAAALQAATGIAPLTTQSGRQKFVSHRWACSHFMKQTFHEYAGLSIQASQWAAEYYRQQLENGKSTQVAKRALAFKWLRIIYRCWQDRLPYDEAKHIQRLAETGAPLAQRLVQRTDRPTTLST